MSIVEELEKHGTLFNEKTLANISNTILRNGDLDKSYLNNVRTFYYTNKDNNVRSFKFSDSAEAQFKIVKFVNTRNFFTNPWCFGFIKEEGSWVGAYAGRHNQLFSQIKKLLKRAKGKKVGTGDATMERLAFPKVISRADVFSALEDNRIFSTIENRLHDSKEWDNNSLTTYLKDVIYIARDEVLFKKSKVDSVKVVQQANKLYLIINSGLLDKFMNFINLKVTMVKTSNGFMSEPFYSVKSIEVVENLIHYGLEEDLPLIDLHKGGSPVFENGTITLSDSKRMEHILVDRVSRLKPQARNITVNSLINSLRNSIDLTLKQVKIDKMFLVPYLNIKWGKVSFLMPFYVDINGNNEVVGAIVLGEIKPNVWTPVTLLDLDIARSNARLLGKIHSTWLINNERGYSNEDSSR